VSRCHISAVNSELTVVELRPHEPSKTGERSIWQAGSSLLWHYDRLWGWQIFRLSLPIHCVSTS